MTTLLYINKSATSLALQFCDLSRACKVCLLYPSCIYLLVLLLVFSAEQEYIKPTATPPATVQVHTIFI